MSVWMKVYTTKRCILKVWLQADDDKINLRRSVAFYLV